MQGSRYPRNAVSSSYSSENWGPSMSQRTLQVFRPPSDAHDSSPWFIRPMRILSKPFGSLHIAFQRYVHYDSYFKPQLCGWKICFFSVKYRRRLFKWLLRRLVKKKSNREEWCWILIPFGILREIGIRWKERRGTGGGGGATTVGFVILESDSSQSREGLSESFWIDA